MVWIKDYFSTDNFRYNKERNIFVAEANELGNFSVPDIITLVNPKTQGHYRFKLYDADKDGTGEDIYGWQYMSNTGIKLLVIND